MIETTAVDEVALERAKFASSFVGQIPNQQPLASVTPESDFRSTVAQKRKEKEREQGRLRQKRKRERDRKKRDAGLTVNRRLPLDRDKPQAPPPPSPRVPEEEVATRSGSRTPQTLHTPIQVQVRHLPSPSPGNSSNTWALDEENILIELIEELVLDRIWYQVKWDRRLSGIKTYEVIRDHALLLLRQGTGRLDLAPLRLHEESDTGLPRTKTL